MKDGKAYELIALSVILKQGPVSASEVKASMHTAGVSMARSTAYGAVNALVAGNLVTPTLAVSPTGQPRTVYTATSLGEQLANNFTDALKKDPT